MSEPYQFITDLAEILSKPEELPGQLKTSGLLIMKFGKDEKLVVDLERLLTLTVTNDAQAVSAASELATAIVTHDRPALIFCVLRLLSRIGVGGRGRSDIVKIIHGGKGQIRISTQLSRFRKLFVGKHGEEELEEPQEAAEE